MLAGEFDERQLVVASIWFVSAGGVVVVLLARARRLGVHLDRASGIVRVVNPYCSHTVLITQSKTSSRIGCS